MFRSNTLLGRIYTVLPVEGVMKMLAVLAFILSAQPKPHINYRVPKEAIDYAELVDCDYSKPPNCRAVNLIYKSGSEVMEIKKEK